MAKSSAATPPRRIRDRVRRFVRSHDLLREGDRVLAGVSGGPDSSCLLITLAALRRSLGVELHAAYFDHGLRGERAAQHERDYVQALGERLDVPVTCGAGDVRAHARGRSLEEAARELRYGFLAETAAANSCSVVAVGHTKDDQAETLLLHLVRGSGLRGLAAMAPSAPWPLPAHRDGPRIVRPLLALSRDETAACCAEAGIEALDDPSNRSRAHLRNRVRHDLLPTLREYNPRIDDALLRLADAAASDVELLEHLASEAFASDAADGVMRVSRAALAAMPASLQRHAVRLAATRLLGDARALSDRHVHAVLRANEGATGTHLDLARGVRVDVEREEIVLSTEAAQALPERPGALGVPGEAHFGDWRFKAELLPQPPARLVTSDTRSCLVDAAACGPTLELRRRRPGDRFQPLGLAQPKKLQDFLVDAHVPRRQRDSVPLVTSEGGIIWVVGQRPAEWAKVASGARPAVRLRAFLEPA